MVHALVDAGERVVVLDNLTHRLRLGSGKGRRCSSLAKPAIKLPWRRCSPSTTSMPSSISPPRSSCRTRCRDPLGYYRNNTANSRALIETAIKGRRAPFHLFLDRRGLRQSRARAGARRRSHGADVALRLLEADDRDHAARRRHRARTAPCDPALLQRRRRRPARPRRAVDQRRHPSHQGRGRDGARPAAENGRVRHRLSHPRRHLHPRLYSRARSRRARTPRRSPICAAAAPPPRSIAATAAAFPCSK